MSIKSGFFNSLAGDRTYFAEDFAMLFQGITGSGILSGVGNMFDFSTNGNMTLSVQSGRAWLDETWTDNDADAVVSFDTADPVLDRYDIVIIEVNKSVDVRQNTIKVITGTPSGDPQLPDLVFTENVKQYGLYTVFIPAGTSIITTTNLTTLIDTPDEIQIVTPSGAPETDPIVGAVNGLVKSDGLGNIGAATEDVDYQGVVAEGPFVDGDKTKLDGLGGGGPETDPIVGAVNGLVKSDGLGNIGAATEDVDYQGVVAEGPFVDGDKTKLDGVESGADKTDAGNVAAAGAAMSGGSFHDTFSDYEAADHIPWGVGGAEKIASDRIYSINKYADTVVSAGVDILRAGGGIQVLTLTANSTLTVDLIQGESLTLHLLGGDTYAVTWPTMVWVGGITPVLTGHDLLVLWFVNGVLYGNYTGPVS